MVRSMYCGKVRFNLRNMPMTLEILIDIITILTSLQDYMEHLLRYLFTKILNKTTIFATFSADLIGNIIFSELTTSIMNKLYFTDSITFT